MGYTFLSVVMDMWMVLDGWVGEVSEIKNLRWITNHGNDSKNL